MNIEHNKYFKNLKKGETLGKAEIQIPRGSLLSDYLINYHK